MSSADRIAKLEALVAGLLEQVARLTAEVDRLKPFEARVAFLEAENAALREKLAKASSPRTIQRNAPSVTASSSERSRAEQSPSAAAGSSRGS